jgi:uncharacterized protein
MTWPGRARRLPTVAASGAGPPAKPVRNGERIALLDVLRGFAILGIVLFNFGPMWPTEGLPFSAADAQLGFLVEVLVHGKFYSLFSLLFGIGFAVFLMRAQARGADAVALFRRRLAGLLLIGLAHTTLIWFGDILTLYALLGFALIPFRRWSDRALLRAAVIVLVLPIPLYGIAALAASASGIAQPAGSGMPAPLLRGIAAFRDGSYADVVEANLLFTAAGVVRRLLNMQLVRVFGMFLLGFWAGRVGLFADLAAHRVLLRRLLLLGVLVGLPGSTLAALLPQGSAILPTPGGWPAAALIAVATPILCLGYAAAIALLSMRASWQRVLRVFAPVGRMALTNYLLQSVVLVGVFHGIGLGLFGQVSLATTLLIATALFLVQVPLSALWLRRYSYGPIEWLWRQFTYGARMPLAREAGQRALQALALTIAASLAVVAVQRPLHAQDRQLARQPTGAVPRFESGPCPFVPGASASRERAGTGGE